MDGITDALLKAIIRKTRAEMFAALIKEESAWTTTMSQLANFNSMPELEHEFDGDIATLRQLIVMIHMTSEYYKTKISESEG